MLPDDPRTNLYNLNRDELRQFVLDHGEAGYRAEQLWQWLYVQKASHFDLMSTLPRSMREWLSAESRIGGMEIAAELSSRDGETTKYALRLPDGQLIETVRMGYEDDRNTACISTQAGCAMGCVFCATGQMGFARHLTAGEIIEQAILVARGLEKSGERLSNVVLMGMGEPFHNYEASLDAIRRMIDPQGLGIGQRHITISTVGLVPAILRFARENLQVRLAISLHAASDEERAALLPVNRRYPLAMLMDAVQEYIRVTGRRVTYEWALIERENDSPEQAHTLGLLLRGQLCHVNAIPLNPTDGYTGQKPNEARIAEFRRIVESYGIPLTVRVRRGIDINAGCGQLKSALTRR